MTDTLPEPVNGATLVWNHESHHVVVGGQVPAELFEFADGSPALVSVVVGMGVADRWLCPACASPVTTAVCACRFPPTDITDPF